MHFHDLAVLNTDRGVVWGEIVISDFSNQETAGIIQDFSCFKVGSIVILKIHGYPDSRLADFIPVLRVIVAALIKDTGFVRDQIKAIFVQTTIDQNGTAFLALKGSNLHFTGMGDRMSPTFSIEISTMSYLS